MATMRTTVRLPGDLLRRAKAEAAETGRSLTAMITEALRRELLGPRPSRRSRPLVFRTFKGTGVRPGVDLNDTSSLMDVMDGRAPSPGR